MDHIKPFYPDFKISKPVWIKILKIGPSQSAYDVLLSRINDLLDDFELYEEFNRKSFMKEAIKYEIELERKNNVKYYHQLQLQAGMPIQSSDYFYSEFYKEFSSIGVCENNWSTNKDKILLHSKRAMDNIVYFFLSKYLLIYANKITHSLNMASPPEETIETKMVLQFVAQHLDRQPVTVQCVFYIIHLFKNISGNNERFNFYFDRLKAQTFQLDKHEVSYEIKYALIQASSACVFKCYADPEYFQKAFEVIQFLVEKDIYFKELHELVIKQRFILIVKIALGAKKIEWVKQFIESNVSRIPKNVRTDFFNYASGLIHFNEHQYNDAVKLMVKINLKSAQFIADYKLTLLKMYFELNDLASFNYQAQTFLKFLSKDKSLNKTHKSNIIDSVHLIKWFFKYKKNKKTKELKDKVSNKNLYYLISNYRDKWFDEKYKLLIHSAA
jgi:hypothetical protein